MIAQLLNMYNHLGNASAEGNYYLSEVMTRFHLLTAEEKKQVCYQLLSSPNRAVEGAKVVDYLLQSSEYRLDFSTWAYDKPLYIRYMNLRKEQFLKKSV